MKKARVSKKIIAAFMAFIIAFASAPIQAIALGIENMEQIEENVVDTGYEIDKDVFLVEEDLSKRGQFEKHYLCSDGTYVSVTYPEAIHYLDANNKWQDVDQSLTYDSASGMYISDKADFEVSFSNKASAENMARIERNGYTLSWGIQTTKKNGNALSRSATQPNSSINSGTDVVLIPSDSISAIIENPIDNKNTDIKDRLVANSDTFALPKISSQISYSNIFDETQNVSLKYTVYHNKIEEDIIISERGDLQSVSMNMDVGTLTPIVNADGSVDLVDANYEMQFHVGIPYMVDAEHSVCNDIQVTAVKDGTSCIITYTPNAEWFESSERVFPMLLDPSITTNDYVSNIEDTYVEENSTAIHSSEQYLYVTRNGTNRRNAIVRVTKLPEIDESMPIVYATLSLTAQSAATDYVDLKAAYLDTGLELNEYDYSLTTGDYFSYTSYSAMDYDETSVTFDVTAHIYEMYADKKFDDENGYDYHGDFVIGYDYATDTTYVPPFYSSEYTTPSVRPVFTVKYGYTLPAGMLNGSVYSFMNAGSFSYMSVNGTSPANNSNIYQVWNEEDVATTSQKFKLEYVSGTGGYLLRSMSSSSGTDKVVSINRAGGELSTNMNVRLSSATDSMAQEWLIVPVDYNIFRIVPRANMSLTLTAYGYNDGTNTGISATSQGNIFVKTRVEDDNFQEWYIYDNSNNEVNTSQYRATIETGNYFLGNSYSGHYLHRGTGTTVNGMSGRISSLGENTVKWKIVNLGDGYCTIQRSDAPRYYLAPASTSSGSNARIYANASETIPENVKWSIRSATGGGCLIQHKASGLYLTDVGGTANPTTVRIEALATPGTDAYKKQVWRVASEDYYVELGLAASFDDIDIDVGESKTASIIKSPSSANWSSYTDFDYTITSGGDYVSYDANTHKFTGVKRGTDTDTYPIKVSVTATHKTTGLTDTFDIKVNKNAIIVIPGILGSELYIGNDNPYFKPNTTLVDEDILNLVGDLTSSMSTTAVLNMVGHMLLTNATVSASDFVNMFYDSLKCNDDGSSKYEVYTKKYVYVEPTYDADNNRIFTLPSGYDARYYTPHAGVGDAYFHLVNALYGNSSYLEQEYQNDDISSQYFIEFFSYDWRLSNAVSANNLNTFINECGYDKVILIAHSMGGLVASKYMAMGSEQLNKVKGVYMLSSPLEGAPEIINVWANEDFTFLTGGDYEGWISFGSALLSVITLSANPIQKLLGNYASIYELFPTQNYLSISTTPYLIHSTGSSSETVCQTYAASMAILSECLPHFNSNLMSNAESFHASCRMNNRHITYETDSYYFCSDHATRGTTIQLKYSESLLSENIEVKLTTTNGDSLVPQWSATVGRTGNNVFEYIGGHMHVLSGKSPLEDMLDKLK